MPHKFVKSETNKNPWPKRTNNDGFNLTSNELKKQSERMNANKAEPKNKEK